MYAANGVTQTELIFNILRYIVPTFILPIFTGMFVMWLDKKTNKTNAKRTIMLSAIYGIMVINKLQMLIQKRSNMGKNKPCTQYKNRRSISNRTSRNRKRIDITINSFIK